MLVTSAVATERYSLERQVHSDQKKTTSAVYYDRQEQRLVTKTFHWSKEFESRRTSSNKDRFKFPSESKNLSSVSPKALESHNIKVSYKNHSLYQPSSVSRTAGDLSALFNTKNEAKAFVNKMHAKADVKGSRFELVTSSTSGQGRKAKDVAVYYNKEKDEFVTKVLKRKRSDSPAFNFPKSLTRPARLDPSSRDRNFSLDESDSYSAKTPNQFQNALARIKSEFKDAKVHFDKDKFSAAYQSMRAKRGKDVLITEQYKKGNKLYRVYYNFDREEMLVQEMELDSKDSSKVRKLNEAVYDLTTEYGYQGARNALVTSKVYTEEQIENFRGAKVTPCRDVLESHVLPNLSGFENVTDALWDRHLHRAVANKIIPGKNRSMFLELNILDKPRRVKVYLDARGQVSEVDWVGMSDEEAEKEGLKLEFKTDEDGQRNYVITTNYPDKDGWKPIMGINADNIKVEKGILKGNLAVFVKGKKSGEFEYEGFEKSIFPFELDPERRGIAKIGKRERLNGSAKNYYDIDAPVDDGSGGIKNGFFKLFFSKNGRREFVRDTIYESAAETMSDPEYKKLITNREIWTISNTISHQLGKKTKNYTTSVTDITAKGAELAYAAFGDEILLRVIKDMLPDESPVAIQNVVLNVTEAFKACLARAGKSRNKEVADQCMEVFKSEAPIYVGKEVLLLKLKQNNLSDLNDAANEKYMACIKEQYRPAIGDNDSSNKVKGCLFQAFLGVIDSGMGPILDKEIALIVEDKGYDFKLSTTEKKSLTDGAHSCFNKNGLQSDGVFGTKYNFSKLEVMEPADFERKLMGCVDNIKVGTGRLVVGKILGIELEKQDISPQLRIEVTKKAIDEGYEACIEKQSKVITSLTADNEKTTNALEQSARGGRPVAKTVKMVKVPTLEPGECANLVMNRTLSLIVPEMVKETIGAQFYDSLIKNSPPTFVMCFDKEEKRLLEELPVTLKNEVSIPKKQKEENAAKRAKVTDAAHATCLKDALSWASYHAVGQIVEDTLKADPEMNKLISLTKKDKELMGRKIQACFQKELENYTSVNEMTEAIDPLKEKCGVQLLTDSEVQQIIFAPIIIGSLKEANVKEENLESWSAAILKGMNEDMKGSKSIDEVVARAKAYKGKAAIQVIDFSLKEQISGFVENGNADERNAEIDRLYQKVTKDLLSKGGMNFEQRILDASKSDDTSAMDNILDEFKLEATRSIGPEVVEMTGRELLKDGLLDTEAQVKQMRSRAEKILSTCLAKRPEGVDADTHINECVVKIKSSTTEWVITESLLKNLTEEENARIFDNEDQVRIIGNILDDEAKKEIDIISRIEDKEEASRALSNFTISVKSKAAAEIVKGVIPYTLDQVLTVGKRSSDQMINNTLEFKEKLKNELIGDFNGCIEEYKKNSKLALAGNWSNEKYDPDEAFNACANKLRLTSMERIMPFKFKEVLRLLSKNEREIDSVIKESQLYFDKCSRNVDIHVEPQEFKYKMDACSAMTIFAFTEGTIRFARDLGDGLFVQNEKTMEEWNACVQRMRVDVIEKLSPFTNSKSLHDFKDNESFMTEAFRMNGQIKDSRYEPVTMEWITDKIKKCGLESLAPNLLQEYKMKVLTDPTLKLAAREQAITGAFLDSMSRILTTKHDGKSVNFNVDTFVKDLNQELDNMPNLQKKATKDYITVMEEFQPLIFGYVKDLVNYDNKAFLEGIKDFEERVKRAIKLNNGNLSIPELKDILVDSKLGDVLLKSLIAKIIKDKATVALKAQGVNPASVVWQLTSSSMINRIFDGKTGRTNMTYIKRKLKDLDLKEIFELLDTKDPKNKANSEKLMKDINGKVIDTLAGDTINGGFVETLFGPIVQKKLTEQRDDIETGFSALFKVPIAGLMGYNRNEFHWGSRSDNRSYSLRNTPSGKQAVQNFSSHVLVPMMKDGLSEKQVNDRVEKYVSPKVKDALGENNVGLWE